LSCKKTVHLIGNSVLRERAALHCRKLLLQKFSEMKD